MNNAWLIIEGPDGAGKTTLANALVQEFANTDRPCVLQHLHAKSEFDDYLMPAAWMDTHDLSVVQDRSLMSDLVYAPVMTNGNTDSRLGMRRVKDALPWLAKRAVVIYLTAHPKKLQERVAERGDGFIKEGWIPDLWAGYQHHAMEWVIKYGGKLHEFDTTARFPAVTEVMMAASLQESTWLDRE